MDFCIKRSAQGHPAPRFVQRQDFVAAAMKDVRLTGCSPKVLHYLIGLYNENHGCAWPAKAKIAKAVGRGPRQVQRAVQQLVKFGWINIIRGGRHRLTNKYAFNWSRFVESWPDHSSHLCRTNPCRETPATQRGDTADVYGKPLVSPYKISDKPNTSLASPVPIRGPDQFAIRPGDPIGRAFRKIANEENAENPEGLWKKFIDMHSKFHGNVGTFPEWASAWRSYCAATVNQNEIER